MVLYVISNTLKTIAGYKNKIASLEKKIDVQRRKELVNLHTKTGFGSRAELIAALQDLEGKGRRKRKAPSSRKSGKVGGGKKRARRTKITADMKKQIVAAIKAGSKGVSVAKKFGISIPSLQNIKKAAGLTKVRKKSPKKVAKKAPRKAAKRAPKKASKPAAKKAVKKARK